MGVSVEAGSHAAQQGRVGLHDLWEGQGGVFSRTASRGGWRTGERMPAEGGWEGEWRLEMQTQAAWHCLQ